MAGLCYLKTNNYEKALEYFDLYLRFEEPNQEINYYKGLCLFEKEDFNDKMQKMMFSLNF